MGRKLGKQPPGENKVAPARTRGRPNGRGPGRPPANVAPAITKERIIAAALQLCKEIPLQDISVMRMAREFSATPALMHYYVRNRNTLTSGVMNGFYRELVSLLPSHTGDWWADLNAVMRRIYLGFVKQRGIVAYVMSHNRYRILQDVGEGEVDYGILFFDRLISCVRQARLNSQQTAMFAHLLLQHALSSAYQQVHHQLPGDHQDYLFSRLRELSPSELPNIRFVGENFSSLTGEQVFEAGLELIVHAIGRDVGESSNEKS